MCCAARRFRNVTLTGALLISVASGAWAAEMHVRNHSGKQIIVHCGHRGHGHEISRGHRMTIQVRPDHRGNVQCTATDHWGNRVSSPRYHFHRRQAHHVWEVSNLGRHGRRHRRRRRGSHHRANWGAIATAPGGAYSQTWNNESQGQAERRALRQCRRTHHRGCSVIASFDTCAAYARAGDGAWGWAVRHTSHDARRAARHNCRRQSHHRCRIVTSLCGNGSSR